ncbi:MAG: hypothetical protein P9M14_00990 [Candidatus Alcyoniella australis]|nr:hypothetical protein [Candidatus Alcyoniella australis]
MKWLHGLTAIALMLILAAPCMAAPGQRRGGGQEKQLEERIQSIRIWKITEFLELDTELSAKLFPVMQQYEDQINELLREQRQIRHGLATAISQDKPLTAEELNKLIDRSSQIDHKIIDLHHEEYVAVAKVLDTERMMKFIAFEIRFQEEIQKIIYDIKHSDRPARGMGNRTPMR